MNELPVATAPATKDKWPKGAVFINYGSVIGYAEPLSTAKSVYINVGVELSEVMENYDVVFSTLKTLLSVLNQHHTTTVPMEQCVKEAFPQFDNEEVISILTGMCHDFAVVMNNLNGIFDVGYMGDGEEYSESMQYADLMSLCSEVVKTARKGYIVPLLENCAVSISKHTVGIKGLSFDVTSETDWWVLCRIVDGVKYCTESLLEKEKRIERVLAPIKSVYHLNYRKILTGPKDLLMFFITHSELVPFFKRGDMKIGMVNKQSTLNDVLSVFKGLDCYHNQIWFDFLGDGNGPSIGYLSNGESRLIPFCPANSLHVAVLTKQLEVVQYMYSKIECVRNTIAVEECIPAVRDATSYMYLHIGDVFEWFCSNKGSWLLHEVRNVCLGIKECVHMPISVFPNYRKKLAIANIAPKNCLFYKSVFIDGSPYEPFLFDKTHLDAIMNSALIRRDEIEDISAYDKKRVGLVKTLTDKEFWCDVVTVLNYSVVVIANLDSNEVFLFLKWFKQLRGLFNLTCNSCTDIHVLEKHFLALYNLLQVKYSAGYHTIWDDAPTPYFDHTTSEVVDVVLGEEKRWTFDVRLKEHRDAVINTVKQGIPIAHRLTEKGTQERLWEMLELCGYSDYLSGCDYKLLVKILTWYVQLFRVYIQRSKSNRVNDWHKCVNNLTSLIRVKYKASMVDRVKLDVKKPDNEMIIILSLPSLPKAEMVYNYAEEFVVPILEMIRSNEPIDFYDSIVGIMLENHPDKDTPSEAVNQLNEDIFTAMSETSSQLIIREVYANYKSIVPFLEEWDMVGTVRLNEVSVALKLIKK